MRWTRRAILAFLLRRASCSGAERPDSRSAPVAPPAGSQRRRPAVPRPTLRVLTRAGAAIRSVSLIGTGIEPPPRRSRAEGAGGLTGRRNQRARHRPRPRRPHRDGAGARQQDLYRASGRQVRGWHVETITPQGWCSCRTWHDPLSLLSSAKSARRYAPSRAASREADRPEPPICWRRPMARATNRRLCSVGIHVRHYASRAVARADCPTDAHRVSSAANACVGGNRSK